MNHPFSVSIGKEWDCSVCFFPDYNLKTLATLASRNTRTIVSASCSKERQEGNTLVTKRSSMPECSMLLYWALMHQDATRDPLPHLPLGEDSKAKGKIQSACPPWYKLNPTTDKRHGTAKTWKWALIGYNAYGYNERTYVHSNYSWFSLHWKTNQKALKAASFIIPDLLLQSLWLVNTRKVVVHYKKKNILWLEVMEWRTNKQQNVCFFIPKDPSVYPLPGVACVYRMH